MFEAIVESKQADSQFFQITRACMLRFLSLTSSSSFVNPTHEELDAFFARLLQKNSEIKQHIIGEICGIDIKTDNHYLILITYLQDLVLWCTNSSMDHYAAKSEQKNRQQTSNQNDISECVYHQSMKLIQKQKIHYSLNVRRCQLICILLKMPFCLANNKNYLQLYNQLETPKEFYPSTIKDHQKKIFAKGIEESIQFAVQHNYVQIPQMLHEKMLNQILSFPELLCQPVLWKLKFIKCIVSNLKLYHEKILYGTAYLLVRASKMLAENYGMATNLLTIYDIILPKLMVKKSIVPLCLYNHLIINNLEILQKKEEKLLLREILLSHISQIFQPFYLQYFLELYDWNFMQQNICLDSLKILYEYTQNHSNQANKDYEIYKKHLNKINKTIQKFVKDFLPCAEDVASNSLKKQRRQFYELKNKQYKSIVQSMNLKPKELFKNINNIENQSTRDDYMQKILRILKRSRHIEPKSMINILSSGNPISDQMMNDYLQFFMKGCKGKTLEEFIRLFTSNFFLWGQAQQIQRVIDKLTIFYCKNQSEQNQIFKNTDVAYTFASAIIILNTDLHNHKNENKMSVESFMKMCHKINEGEDLPSDMIKQIFANVKNDEIKTFRNSSEMHSISYKNWMFIALDEKSVPISFYDDDMCQLPQSQFYSYANQLLTNLIDEKQTAKLQLLVERFQYFEEKFDCEIIQKIRNMIKNKPHIAMHILQKVYEEARFQTRNIDDKLISYYWLACNIIENFSENIPYSKVCQFLLITWRVRQELKDLLYTKQHAQLQSLRKMLKQFKKRETKKSIMDMFSKFLANKESGDQGQSQPSSPTAIIKKKVNLSNFATNIVNILNKSNQSKTRAAESILMNLRQQEAKRYQEFLSYLYLFFHLVEDCSVQESQEIILTFYEQFLNLQQCKLGERIQNLKIKNKEKHQFLESYCLLWSFKLLLRIQFQEDTINSKKSSQRICSIFKQIKSFMNKCNKNTINQYLKAIDGDIQNEKVIRKLQFLQIYQQLKKCVEFHEIMKFNEVPKPIDTPIEVKSKPEINQKTQNISQNPVKEQSIEKKVNTPDEAPKPDPNKVLESQKQEVQKQEDQNEEKDNKQESQQIGFPVFML